MNFKAYYLTLDEYNYLHCILLILLEGIANCVFHGITKNIREQRNKDTDFWYIYTENAYQTVIIKNWNQLFGTNSEQTHYKKLLNIGYIAQYLELDPMTNNTRDGKTLKLTLLKLANMTIDEFDEYWDHMNNYRKMFLIHMEVV